MRARVLKGLLPVVALFAAATAQVAAPNEPTLIPAGTKIVLSLKQAISTRNAREGDLIYGETVFPVIAGDRVAVPARTIMQGVVVKVRHAGKFKGHPQLGIRFTALIGADGSVVPLAGQLNNAPDGQQLSVDPAASSIVGDRQTRAQVDGEVSAATRGAFRGALFGLLFGGTVTALRAGAGVGMAAGLVWAIAGRQGDMRLRPGTQIQITLQSPVQLSPSPRSSQQVWIARPVTTTSEISNTFIVTHDENRRQP